MKSIYFLLFTTLHIQLSHAQHIERKIVANENSEVVNKGFSENGTPFLIIQEKTNDKKSKESIFTKYDPNTLNSSLVYKSDTQFEIIIKSQNVETVVYDKNNYNSFKSAAYGILNDVGESKIFDDRWLPEKFKNINEFLTKDYYISIGYNEKEDSKRKKGIARSFKLFRRNLNTLEEIFVDIHLPQNFQVIQNSNTDFVVLSKEFSENSEKGVISKRQEFILKTFDFDGIEQKSVSLNTNITDTELEYKEVFAGNNSHRYIKVQNLKRDGYYDKLVWRPSASGAVHDDKLNKHYYTYSIVTGGEKFKNKCALLLGKFDYNGINIWNKRIYLDVRQKKGKGFGDFPKEILLKDFDEKLGVIISDSKNDYFFVGDVDKENGDFSKKLEFENIKTVYRIFIGLTDITKSNKFSSDFYLKDNFENYTFDIPTVMAYSLNAEFKSFVDSYPDNDVNFYSKITEDGIKTFLSDFDKNEVLLLKFNHKTMPSSLQSK